MCVHREALDEIIYRFLPKHSTSMQNDIVYVATILSGIHPDTPNPA